MVSASIVLALDAISSISSRGLLRASRASSDSEHRAFDHRPWSVCHTERPSIRLYGVHQALANCSISSSSRVLLRASRALSVVFSSPCPSVSAVTAPSRRPGPRPPPPPRGATRPRTDWSWIPSLYNPSHLICGRLVRVAEICMLMGRKLGSQNSSDQRRIQ